MVFLKYEYIKYKVYLKIINITAITIQNVLIVTKLLSLFEFFVSSSMYKKKKKTDLKQNMLLRTS